MATLKPESQPIVDAAAQALDCVSKSDISELQQLKHPSPVVVTVSTAVYMVLGGKRPKKGAEWETIQRSIHDPKLLDRIKAFDKDKFPVSIAQVILRDLEPIKDEDIARSSTAAKSLHKWAKAACNYALVYDAALIKPAKPEPASPVPDSATDSSAAVLASPICAVTSGDFATLKKLKTPPEKTKTVLVALVKMLRITCNNWEDARKAIMQYDHFLDFIAKYDFNTVTDDLAKEVEDLLADTTLEQSKRCSTVGWAFHKWILDVIQHARVNNIIKERSKSPEPAEATPTSPATGEKFVFKASETDFRTIRALANPPVAIRTLVIAVYRLHRRPAPFTWENAKSIIADRDLVKNLKNFDADDCTRRDAKAAQQTISELTVSDISKAGGNIGLALYDWINDVCAYIEANALQDELDAREVELQQKPLNGSVMNGTQVPSLARLTPTHFKEIALFNKPPPVIAQVMLGAHAVLGGEGSGWEAAKATIQKPDFIDKLKAFEPAKSTLAVLSAVRGHIENVKLGEAKKASVAAGLLCDWLNAVCNQMELEIDEDPEGEN